MDAVARLLGRSVGLEAARIALRTRRSILRSSGLAIVRPRKGRANGTFSRTLPNVVRHTRFHNWELVDVVVAGLLLADLMLNVETKSDLGAVGPTYSEYLRQQNSC